MKDDITEELEAMIDMHGLLHVMTGLSLVCSEKVDHLIHNWQDRPAAVPWIKAGNQIEKLAHKLTFLPLP